ncbi:MAG: exosortase [Kiritimatiellae bacterium]|nr:exosortase [Kiritimatiellia bacterium]
MKTFSPLKNDWQVGATGKDKKISFKERLQNLVVLEKKGTIFATYVMTVNKVLKTGREKWPLASLTKEDFIKIGLASGIIGFLFVLFNLQGNTTDIRVYGRSTFSWLAQRWSQEPNFSHGWLIPIVSLAIVWIKRRDLVLSTQRVSKTGLIIVMMGLAMHYVGTKAQQPRFSLIALMVLVWGIPFYVYGWQVAKILLFPCAYLIFAIPLNFLDSLTVPLRIFVSVVTAAILNGLGIIVERSGSVIQSVNGHFAFNVDDPCSGLRSMLALTSITAVYAYFTQKTLLKKWILFLCSVPLAVIGNTIRTLTVALVAQAFGEKIAVGRYHDYSGYIFFPVVIGLMLAIGKLLNTDPEIWRRLKMRLTPSPPMPRTKTDLPHTNKR